ncbi:hypothetical protein UPYG_G00081790 [Umbra pygmaea]|uniref:Uncharacterized protein n=1 Tax=Umbra pygmaea TaxID=75934 RepID=A0ABD0XYC0_UMBPY
MCWSLSSFCQAIQENQNHALHEEVCLSYKQGPRPYSCSLQICLQDGHGSESISWKQFGGWKRPRHRRSVLLGDKEACRALLIAMLR